MKRDFCLHRLTVQKNKTRTINEWQQTGRECVCTTPIDPYATFELQNPFELHKIRRSPDPEALKLWKGRSGRATRKKPGCLSCCCVCVCACFFSLNFISFLHLSSSLSFPLSSPLSSSLSVGGRRCQVNSLIFSHAPTRTCIHTHTTLWYWLTGWLGPWFNLDYIFSLSPSSSLLQVYLRRLASTSKREIIVNTDPEW